MIDKDVRWQQIMRIRREQESQWEAGQRVLVEQLMGSHAELQQDNEAILDLLYSEILLRRRNSETPELSEYARRFPDLAGELTKQFVLDQEAPAARAATAQSGELPELPGLVVLSEIGRGGGGVVYRARDRKLGRLVAVKMAYPALTPAERARFKDDAVAAANLAHPNIVTIHRHGAVDGIPYFIMELVEGGSLAGYIRGMSLPVRLAAGVIAKAAGGVHFANEAGIVHRDLKPGNILLGSQSSRSFDGSSASVDDGEFSPEGDQPMPAEQAERVFDLEDCQPKIVDFGMAKLLSPLPRVSEQGTPEREATKEGYVLGTASYMSPEQARGESRSVERRADVYSLGAILYELLTGKPPFVGEHLAETLRMVVEQEPVSPCRQRPSIPKDIETICLKCLEKEPDRRYATAAELADDLQRFLKGEPILARPPSTAVRMLKWCRRKPLIAGLSAGIALVAILALGLWISRNRSERERLQLEVVSTRQKADLQEEQSKRLLAEAKAGEVEAKRGEEEERRKRLEVEVRAAQQLQQRAEAQPLIGLADVARSLQFRQAESVYRSEALPKLDGKEATEQRARLLESIQQSLTPVETSSRRVPTGVLTFSTDGKYLISGDVLYSSIRLWDTKDWQQQFRLDGHKVPDERGGLWSTIRALLIDPDDPTHLVSAGIDGSIRIWDLNSRSQIALNDPVDLDAGQAIFALAISPPDPNGQRRLLSGHRNGQLTWWEYPTLKRVQSAEAHTKSVTAVAIRADGQQSASAGLDGSVLLWGRDAVKLAELRPKLADDEEPLELSTLAYSPNGMLLIAAGSDSRIHVWNSETRQELRTLNGHPPNPENQKKNIRATAFVNDRLLLSGGNDGTVRLWDVETGELKNVFEGHTPNIYGNRLIWSIAVSPDGKHFASAGQDDSIRVWDLATGKNFRSLEGGLLPNPIQNLPVISHLAYCPEKNLAITASHSNQDFIRAWDVGRLQQIQSYRGLPELDSEERITALAVHPDGSRFVSAEPNGDLFFWNTESGERLQTVKAHKPRQLPNIDGNGMPPEIAITALAWRRQGDRIASTGYDHQIKFWNADTGELQTEWPDSDAEMQRQPQGLQALIQARGTVPLMNPPDDWLLFTKDGSRLLSAGRDQVIRVWNIEDKAIETRLRGHVQPVTALALSADGSRLASGSDNGTIVVWELKTEKQIRMLQLRPLLLPEQFGAPVTVKPASRNFAERERRKWAPHVQGLSFAPDGRWLAATVGDGSLSLINLVNGTVAYRGVGHEPTPMAMLTVDPVFTPRGELITFGSDQTVRRWDFANDPSVGRELPGSRQIKGARQVSASPSGSQWAVAGNNSQMALWDDRQQNGPETWRPEKDAVYSLAYAPDKKHLLIGTYFGRAIVFDLQTQQPLRTYLGLEGNREFPQKTVECLVAVNHDGTLAASTWTNGNVEIWRFADCQPQRTLIVRGQPAAVAFHPMINQLAVTDEFANLYLWDLDGDGNEPTHVLAGPQQSTGLAFSRDGKRLVQTGLESRGVSIAIWEPSLGRLVTTLAGHQFVAIGPGMEVVQVFGAAFSPNGEWLATCGADATVRLWETHIDKNPDNDEYKTVAVLSLPRIRDLLRQGLAAGPAPDLDADIGVVQNWLQSVAFSADNRRLAAVGLSGAVKVFDLQTLLSEAGRSASEIRDDIGNMTSLGLSENRLIFRQRIGLLETSD